MIISSTSAIVFIGTMILCMLIVKAFNLSTTSRTRLRSIANRRENLRDQKIGTLNKHKPQKIVSDATVAKITKIMFGKAEKQRSVYQQDLVKAGLRDSGDLARHLFYKINWASVGMLVGMIAGVAAFGEKSFLNQFLVIILCALVGFLIPDWALRSRIKKRYMAIRRTFPDALDMIVVCAEAGLGLDAALKKVARELSVGTPIMSEELRLTVVELSFFDDRAVAFNNFAVRVDLPEIKAFVNTLIQTERYGTPIAQSMRVLSVESRNERMMAAETKAAQLSAKLTLPIMFFIFIPLLVSIMTPAIIQASSAFSGSSVGK
jgi:tight adherence protein C